MRNRVFAAIIASTAMLGVAHAGETPAPAGAKVYFVNLKDGDTVTSPVTIIFGLSGMGVAPAGIDKAKTGQILERSAFRLAEQHLTLPGFRVMYIT